VADREYKLDELAELSGFPGRTIRLYITEGLLPGPLRVGPRAAYGAAHLERLRLIRRLQSEGLTLSAIRRRLVEPSQRDGMLPGPALVERYQLADDVTVELRPGMAPWRRREVLEALEQFTAALHRAENGDPK
jgi:DNA-binding transcriptional MerR regulator